MTKFCECESYACRHDGSCNDKRDLALYRVGGRMQTLCGKCAEVAQDFCDAFGYALDVVISAADRRRREWKAGDWFCAALLLAAIWVLISLLPAFFDGRVAQVVGR